jgi:hypothetical protein
MSKSRYESEKRKDMTQSTEPLLLYRVRQLEIIMCYTMTEYGSTRTT